VLLAQTEKGLSAFAMPMRRRLVVGAAAGSSEPVSELNGVRIQRLKDKLGTRGLPTAELELRGARAWLVGEEGKGVKEIATMLTITRIHTAIGSASYWARGLAVCRAYSKVRTARGRFLYEHPQHLAWMARETVKYWAAMQFAHFGAALLGCAEQGWEAVVKGTRAETLIPAAQEARAGLLRLLTPVMKAQVSLGAVAGLRHAMECLGGVGYCENNEDGGVLNLAKIFRDAVVNTIWEGTVSVMAEDVARVLSDKRIGGGQIIESILGVWVKAVLQHCRGRFAEECDIVLERLQALISLAKGATTAEVEYRGRDIMEHLETIASATLLLHDANTDGDYIASQIASRYAFSVALPDGRHKRKQLEWQKEAEIDLQLFLGTTFRPTKSTQGKL
jgi:hypothetical protein